VVSLSNHKKILLQEAPLAWNLINGYTLGKSGYEGCLSFFRDLARKKWPASGGQQKVLKSPFPPLIKGVGFIAIQEKIRSCQHGGINEALSA